MSRETARGHLCSRYAAVIAERARTTSRLTPRPSYKFFLRQLVTAASFLKPDGSATHCCDNRGLAPSDPSLCTRGRQVDSSGARGQHGQPPVQGFAGLIVAGGSRLKKIVSLPPAEATNMQSRRFL